MTSRRLSAALEGCRIVLTVDRRAVEIAAALERHGATVSRTPALTIVPHADDESLISRTRELIDAPPHIVVVTTGIGFRAWVEAAEEAGLAADLEQALVGARIVARGAKASGAVQQLGLSVAWVPESETASDLGARLVAEGIDGRRIAVQHHGSGADGLDELFASHGADVVSLTMYRWGPPTDPEAVRASALAAAVGSVDAVLFTSAPGAFGWLAAADACGATDRIRKRAERGHLLLATVGPTTAGPLRERDIRTAVAERGRLGSLLRGVVVQLGDGAPRLATPRGSLSVRSTGAVIGDRYVPLSPSGVALLRELFDARGAIVAREQLRSALPGSGGNAHAIEMTIARLRESLGAPDLIRTVVKRGYQLALKETT